jgi:eukaryotic-like serine/threonine-protein kinase
MACIREAQTTGEEPSFCAILTGLAQGTPLDGKYVIEGVLGVGGMGVVLAAKHLDLDRPVAIKVLRAELAGEERIVERLLREGRAAARIKSRHVAQVIDVGRLESGAPYVVMERLDGCGFDQLLRAKGPLSLADAVDAIVETCEALNEAHADGIVHRDLKPGNLFHVEDSDGSKLVKLLDFGISKNVGTRRSLALTDPHLALGSPNYMAPEQIKAADDVDARADIWALGAILYELVSGRQVFDAADMNVLQAKILLEEHCPLRAVRPDMPSAIERIVRRCLMKNRDARYPDVQALASDLAPYGTERSLRAAQRIMRSAASAERSDSLPPSSRPVALEPRASEAGRIGRAIGWASLAVALAFVGGFLGASIALPPPAELSRMVPQIEPWTAAAQRFARAPVESPEPEVAPALAPELSRASEGRAEPRPARHDADRRLPWITTPRRVYGWTPGEP